MEKEKIINILEWIGCIIIAIILALLIRYFIGTVTIVRGSSMYPTLKDGERLWISRIDRTFNKLPKRGDIITFEAPVKLKYESNELNLENPIAKYNEKNGFQWFINNFLEIGKTSYIKRVIALPNEKVKIENGYVYINGEKLEEDYLEEDVITEVKKTDLESGYDEFTVPENCIFAMGDNRKGSRDCRSFGCIPMEKIEGIVIIRVWPLNKWGEI